MSDREEQPVKNVDKDVPVKEVDEAAPVKKVLFKKGDNISVPFFFEGSVADNNGGFIITLANDIEEPDKSIEDLDLSWIPDSPRESDEDDQKDT